jgi:hypothetical protein
VTLGPAKGLSYPRDLLLLLSQSLNTSSLMTFFSFRLPSCPGEYFLPLFVGEVGKDAGELDDGRCGVSTSALGPSAAAPTVRP